MADECLRKTERAICYEGHTNFHNGKEMEDTATCAALNHLLERMSERRG